MLAGLPIRLSIAAADMARAKQFYAEKLGLTPITEHSFGIMYECAGCRFLIVNNAESAGKASYSLITWETENITALVSELKSKDVRFEDFDLPYLKTENSIATLGADRVAWFRDSEGNLHALAQMG
jgi:catechol 2,3-dioxygenase-like lactoylglutathione lyase family enzyme